MKTPEQCKLILGKFWPARTLSAISGISVAVDDEHDGDEFFCVE